MQPRIRARAAARTPRERATATQSCDAAGNAEKETLIAEPRALQFREF
eukprot:COSAG01_NODE_3913_length_5545_cov_4.588505_9_plen_48_part_00